MLLDDGFATLHHRTDQRKVLQVVGAHVGIVLVVWRKAISSQVYAQAAVVEDNVLPYSVAFAG